MMTAFILSKGRKGRMEREREREREGDRRSKADVGREGEESFQLDWSFGLSDQNECAGNRYMSQ